MKNRKRKAEKKEKEKKRLHISIVYSHIYVLFFLFGAMMLWTFDQPKSLASDPPGCPHQVPVGAMGSLCPSHIFSCLLPRLLVLTESDRISSEDPNLVENSVGFGLSSCQSQHN